MREINERKKKKEENQRETNEREKNERERERGKRGKRNSDENGIQINIIDSICLSKIIHQIRRT